jgi:hypothetical protein
VELGVGLVRRGGGQKKKRGHRGEGPSLVDAGATVGSSGMRYLFHIYIRAGASLLIPVKKCAVLKQISEFREAIV